jgi:hypothetical protein
VLSVLLRYRVSDYPFGIFKLLTNNQVYLCPSENLIELHVNAWLIFLKFVFVVLSDDQQDIHKVIFMIDKIYYMIIWSHLVRKTINMI